MSFRSAWAGAPATSLRPVARSRTITAAGLGKLIRSSGLSGQVACAVADVQSGEVIEAENADNALPPASVAKIVTALYALDTLGAEYRFRTRLLATGPLRNGILEGDLILAGGGDPTLDTDALAAMAAELKRAGLREVRGRFRVYQGALPYIRSIDPEQPAQHGYSPSIAGIALNFNRVHFEWKKATKGWSIAMDARTKRYRPQVQVATMKIETRALPVYTYADKGGIDRWTVASKALGREGARWLPVRKPGLYAGDVLRTMARAHGIVLKPAEIVAILPQGAETLVQHNSEALRVILKAMLRWSNNLTAEMVGMTASAALGKRPGSLRASAARMNDWAVQRLGMAGVDLVDHSGLGDRSRMSAGDLVRALVQVRKRGILRPILKPVALRDAKGKVVKNHPVKVHAKTGTLYFVSGLGGFLTTAAGREMAFVIFSADLAARAQAKKTPDEVPKGARSWKGKARRLQQALLARWGSSPGG